MKIDLTSLPDRVDANDEALYMNIIDTLCDSLNIDPRLANGTIADEYHDVPAYEKYDSLPEPTGYEPGRVEMITSAEMIAYARADLAYYTTHDPADHVDNDVTKPSIESEGYPRCLACQCIHELAIVDAIIALGHDERIRLIRERLDPAIPFEYTVRPSTFNASYHTIHDASGAEIGAAQFNDDLTVVVPMTQHRTVLDLVRNMRNK